MKIFLTTCTIALLALAVSCGGGSTRSTLVPTPTPTPTATPVGSSNVVPLLVDGGPPVPPNGLQTYANGIFATVTICEPGTTRCQDVPDMLVDTGSYGIRVFATQIPSLSLPAETTSTGNPVADCAVFVDSVMWGPVQRADVQIAGELATDIPIHVVGTSPAIPSGCSQNLLPGSPGPLTTPDEHFSANGVLGIGSFREDCGPACALPIDDTRNPGWYFECPSTGCVATSVDVLQQVQNPVWQFPVDNNGIIIQLPPVPGHDAPSVTGSLIFGIGTQANNSLGSQTVFPLDNAGNLQTVYNNSTQAAFLDSGSNALYFGTSNTSLPDCLNPTDNQPNGFYCPALGKNLSATMKGASGSPSSVVSFSILNADTLFSNPVNFVFDNLGGPNPPSNTGGVPMFDWGMPFFFGRNVYFSIDGQTTPEGNSLFVAF